MQTRAEFAGRTTKCPGCGVAITVPEPEAEEPEAEEIEEIPDDSPKTRIKAEKPPARGRKPARDEDEEELEEAKEIDEAEEIEEAEEFEDEEEHPKTGIRAGKPAARGGKPARDEDEEAEEAEELDEEDDRPRKKGKKGKKAARGKTKSNVGLLIGIGVGVFLLLAGGGVLTWFLLRSGGGSASDLAFVPGDAQGFAAVQVAALWKTPLAQQLVQEMPPDARKNLDEMEKKTGLKPDDIDRAVWVGRDRDMKQMWTVLSTTKPIDRKKMLAEMDLDPAERQHQGKTYQVSKTKGGCVHFVNDRMVLLANEEEALKAALNQIAKPSKGTQLAGSLKLVDGRNHVVVGFQVPPDVLAKGKQELQGNPMAAPFAPLLDMQGGSVLVNVAGNALNVEVTGNYPTDQKAKEAKGALDRAKTLAETFGLGLIKDPQQKQQAQKALNSLAIDQRGTDVVVKMSGDIDVKGLAKAAGGALGGPLGGAAQNAQSQNNLKQIGLALINYADSNRGQMPPAVVSNGNQPLYSWRVEILPYVEEQNLYQQLRGKPWNDRNSMNLALRQMPKVFEIPGRPAGPGKTFYKLFTGPKALFDGNRGVRFPLDFPKGTSNTVLAVEAREATVWTQPNDILFTPERNPLDDLGWDANGTCRVLMADGSVRQISRSLNPDALRNSIMPKEGGVPNW
jgi:hypothetical protein